MYSLERKYEQPEFAEFPESEYQKRQQIAQKSMKENNIDGLLLTQKENVEYFSGYMTTHWGAKGFSVGAVVMPNSGEPILIVPDFLRYTAEKTSWIKDIRGLRDAHTLPRQFSNVVIASIKEKGLEKGRIGIEIGRHVTVQMPLIDFDTVRSRLKETDFIDGSAIIWKARVIKSPLEIVRIKKACSITVKAYEKLFELVRPGMTERDISKIFSQAIINNGGDIGFINIRAGPERYPMADTFQYRRKIRKGDMLIVDAGGAYRRYKCDICRVGVVGKPSKQHKMLYDACRKSQEEALHAVTPGIKAEEIFDASMRIIKKSNINFPVLDLIGHGIGLDTQEPPVICANSSTLIEPGMILCIEPWIYDWYGLGVFAIEDQILVTQKGYETLAAVEKERLWTIDI